MLCSSTWKTQPTHGPYLIHSQRLMIGKTGKKEGKRREKGGKKKGRGKKGKGGGFSLLDRRGQGKGWEGGGLVLKRGYLEKKNAQRVLARSAAF